MKDTRLQDARGVLAVVSLTLWGLPASAATLVVDPNGGGDFSTIQSAVEAAAEGDTVLVGPGTYSVAPEFGWPPAAIVDFGTKNLHVQSTEGPEVTILDGEDEAVAGTWVDGGQTVEASSLRGFTIRRCQMGGVHLRSSSATLRDLVIEDCLFDCCGGGIAAFTELEGPTIVDCGETGVLALHPSLGGGPASNRAGYAVPSWI